MEYLDNVLIKLKRKYSKDETVAALTKKLKEVEIENGKLSAEIAYLEHEAKNNIDSKEINKLAGIEARKEKLYQLKLNENKKLRKENSDLKKHRNELMGEVLIFKTKLGLNGG